MVIRTLAPLALALALAAGFAHAQRRSTPVAA
jgi:hypothetical protein